jgi:predicted transcriptional regulator
MEIFINKNYYGGIMELSRTVLQILEQLGRGLSKPMVLAKAIEKSPQQVYASLAVLENKGFVTRSRRLVQLSPKTHVSMLVKLLIAYPNLEDVLPDSGITILAALIKPLGVKELANATGLMKSVIYKKVRQGINLSILRKEGGKYLLNDSIWAELKETLAELMNYDKTLDPRVPVDAIIYHKTDYEIVFSTAREQDASVTAFSAYRDYGLSVFFPVNYYYLPVKKLSLRETFLHSLYVAEKDNDYRELVYAALFYLKHKNSLKGVKSPVLEMLKKALTGEKISGYPELKDIAEKAQQYKIKVV